MISSSHFFKKSIFSLEQYQNNENPQSKQSTKFGPWHKKKRSLIDCSKQKLKKFRTEQRQINQSEKSKPGLSLSIDKRIKLRAQTRQLLKNSHSKCEQLRTDNNQIQLKPIRVRKFTSFNQVSREPAQLQIIQKKVKRIPVFRQFNFMNSIKKNKRHDQFYVNYWQKMKTEKQLRQSKILKKNILLVCQNNEQKK